MPEGIPWWLPPLPHSRPSGGYDQMSSRALLIHIALQLDLMQKREVKMDQVLADLTNAVEITKTTSASAITLINGIADRIDALNKDRDAALVSLTQQLRDNATALATAVDAQAPAQPPVVATIPAVPAA